MWKVRSQWNKSGNRRGLARLWSSPADPAPEETPADETTSAEPEAVPDTVTAETAAEAPVAAEPELPDAAEVDFLDDPESAAASGSVSEETASDGPAEEEAVTEQPAGEQEAASDEPAVGDAVAEEVISDASDGPAEEEAVTEQPAEEQDTAFDGPAEETAAEEMAADGPEIPDAAAPESAEPEIPDAVEADAAGPETVDAAEPEFFDEEDTKEEPEFFDEEDTEEGPEYFDEEDVEEEPEYFDEEDAEEEPEYFDEEDVGEEPEYFEEEDIEEGPGSFGEEDEDDGTFDESRAFDFDFLDDPDEPPAREETALSEDHFVEEPEDMPETGEEETSLYEWNRNKNKDKPRKKKKKEKKERKKKKKEQLELMEMPERRTVTLRQLVIGDGTVAVCVPVVGETREEIASQAVRAAGAVPDLTEWRADCFEQIRDPEAAAAVLAGVGEILGDVPILFTFRTETEGGRGSSDRETYTEVLRWAAGQEGIDMIDVEACRPELDAAELIREIHENGIPVMASVHFFDRMPKKKELNAALRKLEEAGGDVLKIAVMPETEQDVLDMIAWTAAKSRWLARPLVTMAMGDIGRLSRVTGGLSGSAVTFGSAGRPSAPGQIPVAELRAMLEQLRG